MTDVLDRMSRLLDDLDRRRPELDRLHTHYHNRKRPSLPPSLPPELRALAAKARTAWGALVVDVVAERLVVDGVRSAVDGGADLAWSWWQASKMDARQVAVHTDALLYGDSYVLVWPGPAGPAIRGLDRRDTTGARAGSDPALLAEAVHVWRAGGAERCTYYDARAAYMYARPAEAARTVAVARDWLDEPDEVLVGPSDGWVLLDVVEHGLGACPVVRIANRPNLRGEGASDLEPHIDITDRIAEDVMARLVAGNFSGYRQRWASGMSLGNKIDPQTGEPVLGPDGMPVPAGAPFEYGADKVWINENPDGEFGDFAATDLRPLIEALDQDIKHLAAASRTPAHYLLSGSANPPSEGALLAAEAGLADKVGRRQLDLGEAWEIVFRLAAAGAGELPLAADQGLEVVWRNTEVRSLGAVADALLKLKQMGLPLRFLLELFGFSPQSIEQIAAAAADEQAEQARTQATAYGLNGAGG